MNDTTKQNLKAVSQVATVGGLVVLAVSGLLGIAIVWVIGLHSVPAAFNEYARRRENKTLTP